MVEQVNSFVVAKAKGKGIMDISRCGVFLFLTFFAFGCTSLHMNVKAYLDPEQDFSYYRRFKTLGSNTENPLLEKQLLLLVKKKMLDRGFICDEKNPEFIIMLSFYSGAFNYYKPPATIYLPQYTTGETKNSFGTFGGISYSGHETSSGKWESKPTQIGGGTATAYYRNIRVNVIDYKPLTASTPTINFIWQGEVDSSGSTADILDVAPFLLDELLGEFPTRTDKGTERVLDTYDLPIWARE